LRLRLPSLVRDVQPGRISAQGVALTERGAPHGTAEYRSGQRARSCSATSVFQTIRSCTDCSWRGRERLLSTTVVAQVVLVGARKASVVSKHAMSICDACRRAPDAPHTRPTPASLLPGYAPCGPGCPGRPHRTVMTTREPPLSSVTGIPHAAVSSGGEAQDSGVCLRACATV
jgi:hypothetical protein